MDISLIRNERQLFSLFELSALVPLAQALGIDEQLAPNKPVIQDVIQSLLIAAGQEVSGLILEPDWSLPAYTKWVSGTSFVQPPALVLRLDAPQPEQDISGVEDSAQTDAAARLPVILPSWGVEHVANNYALAYLELPYHPDAADALAKKQLVAELFDFCQSEQTQLLVKLILADTYSAEAQLNAVQELRATVDLFALEVPTDPLAIATLTAELDTPWIATPNATQNYDQFTDMLSQALENGAQGYVIGQTAWAELGQLRRLDQGVDIDQVKTFINTTFRERLAKLNEALAQTVSS